MLRRFSWVYLLFAFSLVVGIVLRLIWGMDIEYKGDEAFNFHLSQTAGATEPWPWLGMSSGVAIPNPGMSVWVFIFLSKLFHVMTPERLAQSIQLLNVLALILLGFFSIRVPSKNEREVWLWALALACVNPIDLILHRKIWAPSVFPLLTLSLLFSWWKRSRFWPSFFWGLIGALLGQIQMSGFFLAFAFVACTLVLDRKKTHWKGWFLGSFLGALPLIPWVIYILNHLSELRGSSQFFDWYTNYSQQTHPVTSWIDLKMIQFVGIWLVNTLGVGLDYSLHHEIFDFYRYPLVGDFPTYLALIATLITVLAFIAILLRSVRQFAFSVKSRKAWKQVWKNPTFLSLWIVFGGFGALMTMAPFFIQRHYLLVTFPFQYVWLASLAFYPAQIESSKCLSRALLSTVFICQFFLCTTFLGYIHFNHGAPRGDFGVTYGEQLRKSQENH